MKTTSIYEMVDDDGLILDEYLSTNVRTALTQTTQLISQKSQGYKFCIFYGDPAGVNGLWDPFKAGNFFAYYDYIVFGDGIEDPSNPNYAQNQQTIQNILMFNPNCKIFGYIDLGVSTTNHPLSQINTYIQQWLTIGAKGIFLDNCGYDFQTPRSRLNAAVDLVHSYNLPAFINAWNADDVFSSAVNTQFNPSGSPSHISQNDFYLLENFIFDDHQYTSAQNYATNTGYVTFNDLFYRAYKALTYRDQFNCQVFSSSQYTPSITNAFSQQSIFEMIETISLVLGLDGYSFDQYQFSSNGANVNQYNQFNYIRNYPVLKNPNGLVSLNYSINSSPNTLFYQDSAATINATQIYAQLKSGKNRLFQSSVTINPSVSTQQSVTLTSPIFTANKPVVVSIENDQASSSVLYANTQVQNGSMVLNISSSSGTLPSSALVNISL